MLKRYVSIVSTLFVLAVCFPPVLWGFQAQVLKVVDGDTIWVKPLARGEKIKVRVWGIDTPEKYYSRKLHKEAQRCGVTEEEVQYLGRVASLKAEKVLRPGTLIEVTSRGTGRYKRLIGVIKLPNGEDYGEIMIRLGYSCVYHKETSYNYRNALAEAKHKGRGLWNLNWNLMNCLCKQLRR